MSYLETHNGKGSFDDGIARHGDPFVNRNSVLCEQNGVFLLLLKELVGQTRY
jgi:hypothetical protein